MCWFKPPNLWSFVTTGAANSCRKGVAFKLLPSAKNCDSQRLHHLIHRTVSVGTGSSSYSILFTDGFMGEWLAHVHPAEIWKHGNWAWACWALGPLPSRCHSGEGTTEINSQSLQRQGRKGLFWIQQDSPSITDPPEAWGWLAMRILWL